MSAALGGLFLHGDEVLIDSGLRLWNFEKDNSASG
jgi:hypothetical protein